MTTDRETGVGIGIGTPFNPTTGISIERILDGESTVASQNPSGSGTANAVQIEFGPAVNGSGDPVQLLANGQLTFNKAGTYRIKVSLQFGRSGQSNQSELLFRVVDGAGNQIGRSLSAIIDDPNNETPFENDTWLALPAGAVLKFEIMRDSNGDNSGGLIGYTPSVDGGNEWNFAPGAAIRVERWV